MVWTMYQVDLFQYPINQDRAQKKPFVYEGKVQQMNQLILLSIDWK